MIMIWQADSQKCVRLSECDCKSDMLPKKTESRIVFRRSIKIFPSLNHILWQENVVTKFGDGVGIRGGINKWLDEACCPRLAQRKSGQPGNLILYQITVSVSVFQYRQHT